MNRLGACLSFLALAGIGGGAFVLLGDEGEPPPRPVAVADAAMPEGSVGPEVGVATAQDPREESLDRTVDEMAETLPPPVRAGLRLSGRVVDKLGNPVAGAKVRVSYRRSFLSMMGRGRGPLGDRGPAGEESGPGRRQTMEAKRQRFRSQPLGEPVTTGADGAYSVASEAYEESSLTIAVTHDHYAPAVARCEWQSSAGELRLKDIVLEAGLEVAGVVLDENDRPIPGALVRYEVANEDPGFGPLRGPRMGRGGFGPFGGGREIQDLIGSATTDSLGVFRLGPVPVEPFQLAATAEHFLDGRGRRIDPIHGQPLPEQRIVLLAAAGLSGIVQDAEGKPVAKAVVRGEVSRDAMMAEFRAAREASGTGRPDPNSRNGGGRDGDPLRAEAMARWRDAAAARDQTPTNEKGEFRLEKLPRAQVRLTVEHPAYLTTVREPVDVRAQSNIVIVLPVAFSVSGVVVDAATGLPVETYGIAASRVTEGGRNDPARRPWDGGQGWNPRDRSGGSQNGSDFMPSDAGPGGRGQGRRRQDAAADPAANAARRAEVEAQQASARRWLQQNLGPSGRLPGRTPKPEHHANGRFEVGGLQVGDYGFDIDAPGYVKTATAAVHVEGPVEGLVLQVERGAVLVGRVESPDHLPIAMARVELLLPDPPASVGPIGGLDRGGRAGRGGFRGRGLAMARGETAADGTFELPPVRPGTYRLRVSKDGWMDRDQPSLVLSSPGPTRELLVTLTRGGVVTGIVRGMEAGKQYRVTLTGTPSPSRYSAPVDTGTGEYRIEGLPAGAYFASLLELGGDEQSMRAMLARAMAEREKQTPDLLVPEGGERRYDFVAGREGLGIVMGSVFHNGRPASGATVRLSREDSPPQGGPSRQGDPWRGSLQQIAERLFQTRVAADGSFSLESIPPGNYRLVVEAAQGLGGGGRGGRGGPTGRGGSRPLHEQDVAVRAFSTESVQVDIQTSSVEFRVAVPEALARSARPRVFVALEAETASIEPAAWRRLPSFRAFEVRDGTTGPQDLAPGVYRYQVSGRGLADAVGSLSVVAGQTAVVPVQVQAAPDPGPGSPGQGPGNGSNRGENRANRRGTAGPGGTGISSRRPRPGGGGEGPTP
ncbi:MAG: hypothetical protein Fur0037_04610 [Planctomycetota bacterium]